MPYITREDGERFVIPSYRDVLTAKNTNQLKKEILLLSQSYGEYITLQRKSSSQYEVAFSPDTGYLLGESIWHYFQRPLDLIYCEAIPNTTEAILVIVKAGSVYLDGSFPLDSIPEELIIFLTQQNNFEIYTYGDVPISETPEEGKFSFEPSSIRSFTVLEKPVFPTLPLIHAYELQLVATVLREHGIGVFPIRRILTIIGVLVVLWLLYSYITSHQAEVSTVVQAPNPYQGYNTALTSPAPDQQITAFMDAVKLFFTVPGWHPTKIDYSQQTATATMQSAGSKVESLFGWAKSNKADVNITQTGIYLITKINVPRRPIPNKIYPLKQVIAMVVDQIAAIYPGNNLTIGNFRNQGSFSTVEMTIKISNASPLLLDLLAKQLKDLPLSLQTISITITNNNVNGSILITALGS